MELAALLAALLAFLLPWILQACWFLVLRPYVLSRSFRKHGVTGPGYKLLHGSLDEIRKMKEDAKQSVLDVNSDDDVSVRVIPHYNKWFSQYGETFLYWHGTEPTVCISDPELAKQILSTKFGFYVKPKIRPDIIKLVGRGLVFMEGHDWVRHKRILNPAFTMDKLKSMTKRMAECANSMFEEWENQGDNSAEGEGGAKIEMSKEFQKLTADIISHAVFGSGFADGAEAFKAQRELQKCCAASLTNLFIPGLQYLPTPSNRQIWKLDRKMKNTLRKIIEPRLNSIPENLDSSCGDDLLGLMIAATQEGESGNNGLKMSVDEIMEECKTFFFAGHETTSNLLTWSVMLLSLHQDWQGKLRDEVVKECGRTGIPDADMLPKLRLMNMVLLEALRLYCPIILMTRAATEDMKLGHLTIPKGVTISIPIAKIHRKKELWGDDANEFNPLRFANGVSNAAKHPNALLPFSLGPRACIGQNFAMLEAKTVLVMLLQRFKFTLAADYKHAPVDHVTLQPQYGLPVVIQPFNL